MENPHFKLNCRGEIIKIPKFEIEFLKSKDNFLSKLLLIDSKNNDNEVHIWENKDVVQSIIDSIRLNKVIIHKNVDQNYYFGLCDKWNIDVSKDLDLNIDLKLIDKIKAINQIYNTVYNPNDTKRCISCHVGFKEKDNHDQACRTHRWSKVIDGVYECCGSIEPCRDW